MPTKILLIDPERAFARDVANALQARRAETRICAEGQHGLEEARSWRPDAIVLCVELPGLSGYSVCNKLKKDDQLRGIPLVLTSAEATQETFEQHRKLRTRAEEYLLKPCTPEALVRVIAALVELPAPTAAAEGLAEDDLRLIDRVFDELASIADAGAAAGPPAADAERPPALATEKAPDVDGLRARVAALEAELARVRADLVAANADRERLAEAQRAADATREKARRALAVVLQALEDPRPPTAPADPPPRRE